MVAGRAARSPSVFMLGIQPWACTALLSADSEPGNAEKSLEFNFTIGMGVTI